MPKPTTQDKALEPESRLPLALIIGGTGLQGSGCIQDLIVSNRLRLRTTSRNARSKAALALAAHGVELYEGSLLDRPFVGRAMAGVHSLFLVTFSDHDGSEVQQGKNLGDAAIAAGVKRVVFSGGERIGVYAMDNKFQIEEYLRTLNFSHIVYLHTAFFYENIVTKRGTKRVRIERNPSSGRISRYFFSIPLLEDMAIPFISPKDIGRVAATVLLAPHSDIRSEIVLPIAGDVLSPKQFVEKVANLTGVESSYTQLPLDFFQRLPIPGSELIVEMYKWYHARCPGEGHSRDPESTRSLCPSVRNADEWLQSGGLRLINDMAFEDGITNQIKDALMGIIIRVYGAYSRIGSRRDHEGKQ